MAYVVLVAALLGVLLIQVQPDTRRRPWLAALLTAAQPGLGHVYAGRLDRGLVVFAALLLAGAANVLSILAGARGWWLVPLVLLAPVLYAAAMVDALLVARRAPVPYVPRPYNRASAYVLVIVLGLGLAQARDLLTDRWFAAYRIPSEAMAGTVLSGEWLWVDRRDAARGVARDGLVVYRAPDDSVVLLKRVAGLPGDRLLMRNDTLIRNGQPVLERYVTIDPTSAAAGASLDSMRNWGPVTVSRDGIFVLGDSRHASKDSRHVGEIPLANVIGRPLFIYYSYDPQGDHPLPFLTAIRWSRLGLMPR